MAQKLGLALSLPTVKPLGGWTPARESSLVCWFQKAVGVTASGSAPYGVSQWNDQSTNANHLVQATLGHQPTYTSTPGITKGTITFDGTDDNLDFTSQISISDDFTMAFRMNITTTGRTLFADNSIANEWMKTVSTTTMRFKIGGSVVNLSLGGSDVWGDDYVVFTRSSNVISTWWNGVLQTDTETLSGTVEIDNFGVRLTDTNPFAGWVREIQLYDSSSAELTADVINSIKNL
tara:strand:+ start:4266 stop:4967 length:702 start_codon:yes stop_codon:yes gene_type:complete